MSRGPMENEAAAARPVVIRPCAGYSEAEARSALEAVLAPLGGLHWVKPGMCVAIKANLITAIRPENAATTHPALLGALTRLLLERGARVVIGDSPGGVFNRVYVERVYEVCGLRALEDLGAALNRDFRQREQAFPQGKVLKSFTVTSWLDEADAVINFCKLKVHAMMAMTAATKNLFGIVPGAVKAEYHYRFPRYEDFADMLVDLNEYLKPRLNICDAVVAMEGNGPTQGTPKALGAILASESPYALDLAAAWLLDLKKEDVPYLEAAYRRGLIPAEAGLLTVDGDPVNLTPLEFRILRLLMSHPGQVFSPKEIYQQVWGEAPYGAENAVAVHIRHLREKLEFDPAEPRYIKVIWGKGYRFENVQKRGNEK